MSIRMSLPEIQKMYRRAEALGGWEKWGVKTQIVKEFKITMPTLNKTLKQLGKSMRQRQPRKVAIKPRYMDEWENSELVAEYKRARKGKANVDAELRVGRVGWLALNKKDPFTWTEEDFLKIWFLPELISTETNLISYGNAICLRQWMNFVKRYDLTKAPYFSTKNLKGLKGKKKNYWIKSEDELIRVIHEIQAPDTLLIMRVNVECGARFSSTKLTTPDKIDYTNNIIYMKEPKVDKWEDRIFTTETITMLRRYIFDFDIKPRERLFKRTIQTYNSELKLAGARAQLSFIFTTHTLKHTFVSLASSHGVSLEIVSDQTGTDPTTLKDFYLAINLAKRRYELLGEPYEFKKWGDLIRDVAPHYESQYEKIVEKWIKINGLRKNGKLLLQAKKKKKTKKKRALPWKAIDGIIASPKSNPKLVKIWKRAREYHNAGLTDTQVRKKMGWK